MQTKEEKGFPQLRTNKKGREEECAKNMVAVVKQNGVGFAPQKCSNGKC